MLCSPAIERDASEQRHHPDNRQQVARIVDGHERRQRARAVGVHLEPGDGRELERLVCAMLNLTGLAKRLVDARRGI